MNVTVNITSMHIYVLVGVILFFGGTWIVQAYGSGGPPSLIGHTLEEVDVNSDLVLPADPANAEFTFNLMFTKPTPGSGSSPDDHARIEYEEDTTPQIRFSEGIEVHGEGQGEPGSRFYGRVQIGDAAEPYDLCLNDECISSFPSFTVDMEQDGQAITYNIGADRRCIGMVTKYNNGCRGDEFECRYDPVTGDVIGGLSDGCNTVYCGYLCFD